MPISHVENQTNEAMDTSSTSSQSASRNSQSVWHTIHYVSYVEETVYSRSVQLNALIFLTTRINEALTRVLITGYGKRQIEEFTLAMESVVEAVVKGSSLKDVSQSLTTAWNMSSPIEEIAKALELTNNTRYIEESENLRQMYLDASEFKDFLERAQKGLDYQEYVVGLLMVTIYREIVREKTNRDLDED